MIAEVQGMKCAEDGCDGELCLRSSSIGYFYGCSNWPHCNGAMPANKDGSPRGEPRTRALQAKRNQGHQAFDPIWKEAVNHYSESYTGPRKRSPKQLARMARARCYAWLANQMNLTTDETHFFLFNEQQCEQAIALLEGVNYKDIRKWWHRQKEG